MNKPLPKNRKIGFYRIEHPVEPTFKTQAELKAAISRAFKRIRDGYIPTMHIRRMKSNDNTR